MTSSVHTYLNIRCKPFLLALALFAADGINTLNFVRFVAGLPCDVTLDPTEQIHAMHGAVLLAASTYSHWPPRPADMPQAFYDIGYSSTSASNIGWGPDLESFQLRCMDDEDASNIDRVGHRRWILNPPMARTGMGFAADWMTTYAFDHSRLGVFDYDFIAWPPAGPMPVQLFGSAVPWSVTLNPARYDWIAGVQTVTLRRVSDNRIWTFTSSDADKNGEYFNFDTVGYGIANCIIFRPAPSSITYHPGDVFEVTISGGIFMERSMTPATVRYTTVFIPLGRSDAGEEDDTASTARPLAESVAVTRTIDHADDQDWYAISAQRGVTYSVSVTQTPGVGLLTVSIFDGSTTLYEWTSSGDISFEWVAPVSKGYRIRVTGQPANRLAVPHYALRWISIAVSIEGPDRFETAVAASGETFTDGLDPAGPRTVVIATGRNWPDALGGAALAGALGGPVLLVDGNHLPGAVMAEIVRLGTGRAVILGGTGVVSADTETYLRGRFGTGNVVRLAGENRYETAVRIAQWTVNTQGHTWDRAGITTGLDFPDALAGGVLQGNSGSVMLLTSPGVLDLHTRAALEANRAATHTLTFFGGTGAVSEAVRAAALSAAE